VNRPLFLGLAWLAISATGHGSRTLASEAHIHVRIVLPPRSIVFCYLALKSTGKTASEIAACNGYAISNHASARARHSKSRAFNNHVIKRYSEDGRLIEATSP
jgi:hypothetical protein